MLACFIAIAIGASNADAAFNITAFKMQPQTPSSTSAPLQAGGHPSIKFNINPDATLADGSNNATGDDLKRVVYEFPAGMLGSPQAATTKCTATQFSTDKCPSASYIGSLSVPLRIKGTFGYTTLSSTGSMYILDPPTAGSAVTVGFIVRPKGYRIIFLKSEVTGLATVRSGLDANYGVNLTIDNIPRILQTTLGKNVNATIINITAILNNKANTSANGPYFTYMPTRCDSPSPTRATALSYAGVSQVLNDTWTATGCTSVPFTPTASVTPSNVIGGDPVNWTANFTIPTASATIQQSHIKSITTDLPAGTQLNTTAITNIPAICDEVDVNADTCPAGSKIGTANAHVPLLSGTSPNFVGDVYVTSKVNGIRFAYIVRGPNNVKAMVRGFVSPVDTDGNGSADFIRAYSENMPQAPFSPAQIVFNTSLVKNAATCGLQTIKTVIAGWSGASWTGTNTYNITVCGPAVPDTSLVSGPSGLIKDRQPTWTFAANPAAGSTFQSNLDNAGYVAMAGNTFTPSTPLSDGPHNLKVRACNSVPVCDATVVDINVMVDATPPNLTILSPANNALINSTTVPVTFSFEAGSTVTCSIDGGAATACSSPKNYTGLAQGAHTVTVVATDTATNTNTKSVDFTVDSVGPTVPGSCSPSGSSATCTFAFSEPVVSATCKLNTEASATPCTSPKSYSSLPNGNYTVTVSGTDAAGNPGTGVFPFTISVDLTPPNTAIASQPANPTNDTNASFTYTSNEPNGTYECSLDGAPATVCSVSGISYSSLLEGSHTFTVAARDAATNIDPTPASYTWLVDTTPPPAPGCAALAPLTSSTSIVLSCAGEAGATLEYSRDGGGWTVFTSPVTLTGFTNGAHTVAVRQTDAAGNLGSAASQSWTVDNIAPDTTIDSAPSGTVGSTSASISFSSSEAGSTFECSDNGAAFSSCTSPVNLSGLGQGARTFAVRATDAAGNTDVSPAQASWTVDTIGPNAPTITSGPSGTVPTAAVTFLLTTAEAGGSLEVSVDGGSYASSTNPLTLSTLGDGPHTVCFRQLDGVGNPGTPVCRSFTIDTTAPPAPSVSGPSGTIPSASATISFTDAEAGVTFECSNNGAAYAACTSPVSLTGLPEGLRTFAVRAVDAVGNISASSSISWTVQTVGPPPPSVVGPSGDVASTDATITFTDTQAGATFECSLDSAVFTDCTSPVSLTGLSQGAHTFSVRAKDNVGNLSSVVTIAWTVDTIAPSAPSVSGPSGTVASESATITWSNAEAGGTNECNLDGAAFASCSDPVNLTGLSQGAHTYYVRQIDAAGNEGATGSVTWTVDTVGPPAPSISGPSGTVASTSATITFTDSEAGVTFECSENGAAFAACTSPVNLAGLAQGPQTFAVRAKDAVGNTGSSASIGWSVDTVGPPVPSVSGPSGDVASTSATITFTDTEAGVTFECSDNGAAYADCTSPVNLSGLAQGARTFAVRAKDAVGNTGGSASVAWTVDTIAPSAPSVSGPSGTVASESATVTWSNAEAGGTNECNLDGAAFASCSDPVNLTGLSQGAHTYYVRQIDAAGNEGATGSVTWTVDTVGPPAPNVSGPTGTVASDSASITFTDSEAGVTFECSANGAAFAACTSPVSLTGLAQGAQTFAVRAKDALGNTGSSASIGWSVDTVGPPVPSVSGPSGDVASTSATITFTDTEAGVTFECSDNGAAYADCTSPVNLSGLAQGARTFAVRAKDAVGNTGGSASVAWTVDTIAPPAPSVSGPSGTVGVQTAAISFSDTEAGVTFECSLDSAAFDACTSPVSLSDLANGPHSYAVRAQDAAGNESTATTINWTVSIIAPPVPNVSGPSGTVASTSASITFTDTQAGVTFECSENGAAFDVCTSPVSLTGLAQGAQTFAVRAKDEVGNTSASTTISWTVDTVGPPAPSVSGPSGIVGSTSASISFSDSEAGVSFECSQDGGAFVLCSSPTSLATLAQGAHTFAVQAKDTLNNVGSATTISWTVDTVVPPAPSVSGPSGTVASTSAAITFSDTEAGVTFECSDNGAAYAACTSPVNLTGLGQGARTFDVRAKDGATPANTSASTQISWTVDTVAPPVPSLTGPADPSALTTASFTFSDTEAGVTFECSRDGGSFAGCTSPQNLTGFANGPHSYAVRATDAVGNTSAAAVHNWVVDTAGFSVSILSGPSGTVNTTNNSFTFVASVTAGTSYECSLNGAAYSACTSPYSTGVLGQGAQTFAVRATNTGDTTDPDTRSFTIDSIGPAVAISSPSGTTGPNVTLAFTAVDPTTPVTTTCQLDADAATSCTTGQAYSGLSTGSHTIVVTATDGASNVTVEPVTWTVDATPPPVPSVSGPTGTVGSTNAAISFTDTEAGVAFECSEDGAAYATCSTPVSLTGLAQGAHSYAVRAKDAFGNTSASSTINWTVDTLAPPAPSVSGPSGTVGSDSASITFSDAEAGVTFECSDNGAAYAACTSPVNLTGLAQGARTFAVRAKDGATPANTSASTSISWTVDTVAPPAPSVSGPSGTVGSDSAAITFSDAEAGVTFECSQDSAAFAACTSPVNLTGLSQGAHTFAVRAKDGATPANTGGATTISWTVDTTPPPAPSVSGP
ncbi:MAG: hypothetical protein JHD02_03265, partial [Thermoleophilaceae bacterium]|nr:hypothetical protein [Thermoleophilaceae bacterium]